MQMHIQDDHRWLASCQVRISKRFFLNSVGQHSSLGIVLIYFDLNFLPAKQPCSLGALTRPRMDSACGLIRFWSHNSAVGYQFDINRCWQDEATWNIEERSRFDGSPLLRIRDLLYRLCWYSGFVKCAKPLRKVPGDNTAPADGSCAAQRFISFPSQLSKAALQYLRRDMSKKD